jgi:hypothetical protein
MMKIFIIVQGWLFHRRFNVGESCVPSDTQRPQSRYDRYARSLAGDNLL